MKPEKVIIIRVGEIFLKGKNRGQFEKVLKNNIKEKLANVDCKFSVERNRYIVSSFALSIESKIIEILKTVFGVHSISSGLRVVSDIKQIAKAAITLAPKTGTFRITANRADKKFPFSSLEICRLMGEKLLLKNPALSVDLHTPDDIVNIDVREEGYTYCFADRIMGAGGMPVGSAGKGLLLLSGGIDSPVAGYLMAKRGLKLDAIHFHSYPYTSEAAQKKVEKLAQLVAKYAGNISLILVPFTKIQEAIRDNCSESFMIAIMRRLMMHIAQKVAENRKCGCLISGESLGQVASQTMESLTVTTDAIPNTLILRPLIGFDKNEIVEIAKKIDTFTTSIEPYEDCCTVFLPEKPVIKPKIKQALIEEKRIVNLESLLGEALDGITILDTNRAFCSQKIHKVVNKQNTDF